MTPALIAATESVTGPGFNLVELLQELKSNNPQLLQARLHIGEHGGRRDICRQQNTRLEWFQPERIPHATPVWSN